MLEDYLKVKTGKDLVNLGVVPKTSSTHLALITRRRLESILKTIVPQINDEMLGKWNSAFNSITEKVPPLVTGAEEIMKYAQEGMKVEAMSNYEGRPIAGMKGVIKTPITTRGVPLVGIEFNKGFEGANNLNGALNDEHGLYVPLNNLKLFPGKRTITVGYSLDDEVVADKKLGHKIRFKKGFDASSVWDSNSERISGGIKIEAGATAMLKHYVPSRNTIDVEFDEPIAKQGRRTNFKLGINGHYEDIQASSLGQIVPADKEEEIKRYVLGEFFPKTVISTKRAERVVKALLLGKDFVFYGPPGGGKSQISADIIDIAQQQEVIFIVDGCQAQCNPYSLFDEDFSKIIDACPECKISYDPNFKDTGFFKKPAAKDVKVKVAKYGKGMGIESSEGTEGLKRMDLAGYKTPKLDGTTTGKRESDFDPEGFHAGLLVRTNNGIAFFDEMDKLRPQAYSSMLKALEDETIKPDQLRCEYPADALIIGTANDHTVFTGPLNDRMALMAIRYPTDEDTSYSITRKGYHKEANEVESYDVGDTHRDNGELSIRKVQMPVIIERAVDALFLKFRAEYTGAGKQKETGSNRAKFDALDAARAQLTLDKLFYEEAPEVATAEYAISGIQFAFCSRVQESTRDADISSKEALIGWVENNFNDVLNREEDTWWCRAYKEVAIAKTQIPEIEDNLIQELDSYENNVEVATANFNQVKQAYSPNPSKRQQEAKIMFPFMDYLFRQQPNFGEITVSELITSMEYFMKSRENTSCEIGGEK